MDFHPLGPFNTSVFSRSKKLASLDVGVQRMNVWGHQLSQTQGFSIHNQLHCEVFPINQDLGTLARQISAPSPDWWLTNRRIEILTNETHETSPRMWLAKIGLDWWDHIGCANAQWYVDCSTQSKPFPKKIASRWLHSLFLTQALARWSRKSLRNIKKLNPCRLCSPSNLASEDQRAVWMEDTARACALNGYPWVPQISIAKISVTPKSYLYYQMISSGLYNLYLQIWYGYPKSKSLHIHLKSHQMLLTSETKKPYENRSLWALRLLIGKPVKGHSKPKPERVHQRESLSSASCHREPIENQW